MECAIIVIRVGVMPNSLSWAHATIMQGENISNSIQAYRLYFIFENYDP